MKKIIVIMMLAVAMLAGSASAEAKTTKKSSKSKTSQSAAGISAKFDDGYPNIIGHTYSKTEEGIKMTLSFKNADEAVLTLSKGKLKEDNLVAWEYYGDGLLVVYSIDQTDVIPLYIGDNGKKLYLVDADGEVMYSYGPMRLVK